MKNIKKRILQEADKDYKKFSASLIPNINNVLGVRLPFLRKLAKEVYLNENWQVYIKLNDLEYMEEVMLQGMIIGLVKDNPKNILNLIKEFIPKIDNWSVCDSFCSSLKFAKKNKEIVWEFILPYFNSKNEYELRFAFVMSLFHFIDDEYIDIILEKIDSFKDDRYYSQMSVAWALSICFIKFPQKTSEYLKTSKLDNWTFNKSIQKIRESFRVDKATKEKLKLLIRK